MSEHPSSDPVWIRSGERLPDTSRSVLVMTAYGQALVASYIQSKKHWQYDHEDEATRDRITHWMEIPPL